MKPFLSLGLLFLVSCGETYNHQRSLEPNDEEISSSVDTGDLQPLETHDHATLETRRIESRFSFSGQIESIGNDGMIFGWAVMNEDPFIVMNVSIIVGDYEEPEAILGPFAANKNLFDNETTGSHGFIGKIPDDIFSSPPYDFWLVVEYEEEAFDLSDEPFVFSGATVEGL